MVASMSRRMDCMTIDECAALPSSVPDFQIIGGMRYGREPGEEFDPNLLAHISHGFEQPVNVIAKGLGLAFNGFEHFLLPEVALMRCWVRYWVSA